MTVASVSTGNERATPVPQLPETAPSSHEHATLSAGTTGASATFASLP